MIQTSKKRDAFVAFFVATLDNFGFGIVLVLFAPLFFNPSYAIVSHDTSAAARSWLLGCSLAAFPLAQFFGASLFGDYADRVGRKKALLYTLLGTIVGYGLSACAVYFQSVLFLIVSRLFTGLFAGNISICLAILADLTSKDKSRGKTYGKLTMVYGFSWALSIVVGGILSNPAVVPFFNPTIPFWFTAFLSLTAYIVVQLFLTETFPVVKQTAYQFTKELTNILATIKSKNMRPFLILLLIWSLGWGMAVQWFSAYSIQKFDASQMQISLFFLVQGVCWSLGGSVLNPLLLKKFSIGTTALIGFLVTMLLLFYIRVVDTFHNLEIVVSLSAASSALAMSNSLTMLSLAASEGKQGAAMGSGQSMIALGLILVPVMGSVIGVINLNLIYPVCGLFFLIGTFRQFKNRVQHRM